VEQFALSEDWLLADATGIDDGLFFHWDYAEVSALLRALNDALAKEDGSPGRDE